MQKVVLGKEAREGLFKGVDLLSKVVQTTLGPMGSNVVFDTSYGLSYPVVTKDGVTVAKNVDSDDPLESMGIRLIRQASQLTNQEVGDGTTTSTVLTNEIVKAGKDSNQSRYNNISFIEGMKHAQELAEKFIDSQTIDIKNDLDKARQVAYISANNDKVIGDLVAEAYSQVGPYGSIGVQPSKTGKNYIEYQKGLEFNSGVPAIQFLQLDKPQTVINDVEILVTNFEINDIKQVAESAVLNNMLTMGKNIVLICSDISSEVLMNLLHQRQQRGLRFTIVKAPNFGASREAFLMDIAILTGGQMLDGSLGDTLGKVKESDFGTCKSISLSLDKTVIHGGGGTEKAIEERVKYLKELLDEQGIDDSTKEIFRERLHKISGGVAEIFIDAVSDVQYEETAFRVKDAISAVGASFRGGVVSGGGATLLKASDYVQKNLSDWYKENESSYKGAMAVVLALVSPFKHILLNAGMNPAEWGESVLKEFYKGNTHGGVDVLHTELGVVDLVERGIIDPALVTKSAVRNAIRMAGILLTTSSAIITTGS